jgi:nitrous oxidase accessory protein NosD
MFQSRSLLTALAALALCLAFTSTAAAQYPRPQVFVSAKGLDFYPGTPAQPVRTFAQALTLVAAGGEVVAIDSGDYGPVTITKPVSLIAAPGAQVGITAAAGDAVTVAQGNFSDKVVLRGLTLNGLGTGGNGISYTGIGSLHVENCVISRFQTSGISLTTAPGQFISNLFVKDTEVRDNLLHAVLVNGAGRVWLDRCRLENNIFGLVVRSWARVTIRDSLVASNPHTGISVEAGGVEINMENCLVTENTSGIHAGNDASSTVRVSNSTITGHHFGLQTNGGNLLSRGNNTHEGNNSNGSFTGVFTAK